MKAIILCLLFLFSAIPALAQGGKAEPKLIKFAAGKTSATISGSLKNYDQMDYVFGAVRGQTVTIINATPSQFDFRVFNEEFFSEGDFDSSPTYTFEIPETGDYQFTIRKKQTATRSARFSLRLTIK